MAVHRGRPAVFRVGACPLGLTVRRSLDVVDQRQFFCRSPRRRPAARGSIREACDTARFPRGGRVGHGCADSAIAREADGRQDSGGGRRGRRDERAVGAQVAERAVAVDGEGAAVVAHAGGPVRRGVAVGGRAAAGGRHRRPAAGADGVQGAVPPVSGPLSAGAAADLAAAGPRVAGAVRSRPRGVLRAGSGPGSGSGVRLHRLERPGGDASRRGVPAPAVRVGAELQPVDACGAGAERDVRGVGVGPAGRAGGGADGAPSRQPVGGDARVEA